MRSAELTPCRTFCVALDDGEDFLPALIDFCTSQGIRSAYLPMFLGGFRSTRLVGTCDPIENPDAPVWDAVTFEGLEVLGGGTLAWDKEDHALSPHIHVTVGLKGQAAEARTSHLLAGTVQFISELIVVETHPVLLRPKLGPYAVPTLGFVGDGGTQPDTRTR
ncbi:PPC domain-containing DNA-binding protein [Streptomyces chrestomyceticus]|uniref:PPC domain-containing DNA-binding protein n=1 Tax=Streptomyces chrestomyceticus TaxID=68185 RepID=UPI0033C37890